MTELRFRVEVLAFRMLLAIAGWLPRRWLLALGSLGGMVGYWVDARHRRITLDNLDKALGSELGPARLRRTARQCWRHFGRITVDMLYVGRFTKDGAATLVRYEGIEHIRVAYAKGRGVILFSGHFGHWELIAMMQGFLGLPLALVARPLDNPHLERLLAGLRSRSGNTIIHKRSAVREMIKALRKKIGVAIMIDQDAHEQGVFVPFFGRAASTTSTLARLALRTGAAVVPTYSVPLADGTYRIVYEPEMEVTRTGDQNADVLRLTAASTARLEDWVRRHPELWLWMHRRWKTAPRDQPADGSASTAEGCTRRADGRV